MKIKKPDRKTVILFLLTLVIFSMLVHYWDEVKGFFAGIFT